MQKSEIRQIQWEIANSLFSSLKNGKVLTGHINEIIRICDVHADGYTVAKFLERAEAMARSPFLIQRTFAPNVSHRRLIYRIKLKARYKGGIPGFPGLSGRESLIDAIHS